MLMNRLTDIASVGCVGFPPPIAIARMTRPKHLGSPTAMSGVNIHFGNVSSVRVDVDPLPVEVLHRAKSRRRELQ
jgi:hypothetical protein